MGTSKDIFSGQGIVFPERQVRAQLWENLGYSGVSWKTHTLLSNVSIQTQTPPYLLGSTGTNGFFEFTELTGTSLTLAALPTLTAGDTLPTSAVNTAVNLQDAIAILKMIVGLPVNGNDQATSPYQVLAADYDGNGAVGLNDAIAVLKHVVGLDAPQPAGSL